MTQQQQKLVEELTKHPEIEARIVELFAVVGDSSEEFSSPDAAEEFLIKGIDKLGQELLKGWATDRMKSLTTKTNSRAGTTKHSKKKFGGIPPLEK